MANGNQQRCCLIGTCCPPGSAEQRDAFQAWLTEKIMKHLPGIQPASEREAGELVSGWLDELPWSKEDGGESLADPEGSVA